MEGATVIGSSAHPVDFSLAYRSLRELSNGLGLLDDRVTNYVTLECLTVDLLRDAYQQKRHHLDVVHDILWLWFPSLSVGLNYTGYSWSHFWDLDLEVGKILGYIGYYNEDKE
jgi:hypothetical protein